MTDRVFPALTVSGLAIHTVDKFPSNLGCRDDKRRDVAHVLWDSESETETQTESYEEACDWAALLASAPKLLAALELVINHVGHYATMPHAHPDAHRNHATARAAIAAARGRSAQSVANRLNKRERVVRLAAKCRDTRDVTRLWNLIDCWEVSEPFWRVLADTCPWAFHEPSQVNSVKFAY